MVGVTASGAADAITEGDAREMRCLLICAPAFVAKTFSRRVYAARNGGNFATLLTTTMVSLHSRLLLVRKVVSLENRRGLTAPGENARNPRTFRGLLAPGYCEIVFLRGNKHFPVWKPRLPARLRRSPSPGRRRPGRSRERRWADRRRRRVSWPATGAATPAPLCSRSGGRARA